jgi:hypothetical protein
VSRALRLALLLTITAQPLAGQGQGSRIPRKWLVAGIGALITGSIATVYALSFNQDIGGCSKASCVVPVSVALGAGVGFLIGKEMDDLYALRYSHAPPIDLRGRELPLAMTPNDLVVQDSTVLVTGGEGVEVVRAGPTLERLGLRARGLRGIGPVTVSLSSARSPARSPTRTRSPPSRATGRDWPSASVPAFSWPGSATHWRP